MTNQIKNPLDMSDEDISKMTSPPIMDDQDNDLDVKNDDPDKNISSEHNIEENEIDKSHDESADKGSDEQEQSEPESEKKESEQDGSSEQGEDEKVNKDEEAQKIHEESDKGKESKTEEVAKDGGIKPLAEGKEKDAEEESKSKIDYEAEYKRLLEPFKASGRQVQINNIDEAKRLMKMGVDYNKKMSKLKPDLKYIKMLSNNGLLDENKLSYLIDLDKKNPEAITKLIKDSGIDPIEVDINEKTEYKPNTYTVDDRQVELDVVLADIEHTESYPTTIDIISNKWDESSKVALYNRPSDIRTINDQIASGVYDQIDTVVQNQRILGNLSELSDMDAYLAVGTHMQKNRLFSGQKKKVIDHKIPDEKPVVPIDPKLKDRKIAASTTKGSPSKIVKKEINPLNLDDEAFSKLAAPTY